MFTEYHAGGTVKACFSYNFRSTGLELVLVSTEEGVVSPVYRIGDVISLPWEMSGVDNVTPLLEF